MDRQTIDAYDAGAERWLETRYRPGRRAPLDAALQFREAVGAGLILDLGCGPGKLMPDLGDPVLGLDASRGMLAKAKQVGARRLVCGDAVALPFARTTFGGVFANFSLQHLPRDAFRTAITEACAVLRPGGLLQLTMHSGDTQYAGERDGIRADDDMPIGRWFTYWTARALVEVLEGAFFQIVAAEDSGSAITVRACRPREGAS